MNENFTRKITHAGKSTFASIKYLPGFNANSLEQTFALLYEGAGLEGASSHSGRRTFLTNLANKGTAIHILKTLAGHRSISTTAAYLYSSPSLGYIRFVHQDFGTNELFMLLRDVVDQLWFWGQCLTRHANYKLVYLSLFHQGFGNQ